MKILWKAGKRKKESLDTQISESKIFDDFFHVEMYEFAKPSFKFISLRK